LSVPKKPPVRSFDGEGASLLLQQFENSPKFEPKTEGSILPGRWSKSRRSLP
jgi:hypothetical protein